MQAGHVGNLLSLPAVRQCVNIMNLEDFGVTESVGQDTYWIVYENPAPAHESLATVLCAHNMTPKTKVLLTKWRHIMEQILDALTTLHEVEWAHYHMTLNIVMVRDWDLARPHVLLTDFKQAQRAPLGVGSRDMDIRMAGDVLYALFTGCPDDVLSIRKASQGDMRAKFRATRTELDDSARERIKNQWEYMINVTGNWTAAQCSSFFARLRANELI
jgi:hypothetical protein